MSKRILVVDDEPDVNITLRKVLEKNGFIVDSYENPFLASGTIVKSADPVKDDGASLKKMLAEMEALIANGGYALKSITECNGQIFVFLINESELKRSKKEEAVTTSSSHS